MTPPNKNIVYSSAKYQERSRHPNYGGNGKGGERYKILAFTSRKDQANPASRHAFFTCKSEEDRDQALALKGITPSPNTHKEINGTTQKSQSEDNTSPSEKSSQKEKDKGRTGRRGNKHLRRKGRKKRQK